MLPLSFSAQLHLTDGVYIYQNAECRVPDILQVKCSGCGDQDMHTALARSAGKFATKPTLTREGVFGRYYQDLSRTYRKDMRNFVEIRVFEKFSDIQRLWTDNNPPIWTVNPICGGWIQIHMVCVDLCFKLVA